MFTDRQLKSLKPKDKPFREFDRGNIPGFCIQVTPKGAKTFQLNYTFDGRRRFMSLGRYPAVSLKEARDKAVAAREEVEKGNNPMVGFRAKGATRQRTGTVRDAVELYVEDMKERGKSSWEAVEKSMEADVFPEIGDLLARDVRPDHIQRILANVLARGVAREHNKVRSKLHAAMNFALRYDHDPRALLNKVRFGMRYNPVSAVPKDKVAQNRVIERNLSFDEVKALWHFDKWHKAPHMALKLQLALGGLRPVEILGMRYSEVDFQSSTFTIPPERFKTRRYHVVPLGSLAREILMALREDNEVGYIDYVFPTMTREKKISHYRVDSLDSYLARRFSQREDKKAWPAGVGRFTPMDIRRTWKTRTGEIGIDKEIRDRIQGHALSDVSSKHYDRWDYLDQKREAMDEWDAFLRKVVV